MAGTVWGVSRPFSLFLHPSAAASQSNETLRHRALLVAWRSQRGTAAPSAALQQPATLQSPFSQTHRKAAWELATTAAACSIGAAQLPSHQRPGQAPALQRRHPTALLTQAQPSA